MVIHNIDSMHTYDRLVLYQIWSYQAPPLQNMKIQFMQKSLSIHPYQAHDQIAHILQNLIDLS